MVILTFFQKLELILIPIIFVLSYFFLFVLGYTLLGDDVWIILGTPVIIGFIFSILISFFLNYKNPLYEFKQLELLFRVLILGGAGLLIPILLLQLFGILKENFILSILSLIISTIGGIMILMCLLLLYRSFPRSFQLPSE